MDDATLALEYLPVEYQLALYTARTILGDEERKHIEQLLETRSVNWNHFARIVQTNRLVPLIYPHLSQDYADAVPSSILSTLRHHFQWNGRRNLYLAGELVQVLNALHTHGIPALPFKGPSLAVFVYGDLTRRAAGDLDILIPPHAVSQAAQLLRARDYYRRNEPQMTLDPVQEAFHMRYRSQFVFIRDRDRVCIDLQWRLSPYPHWAFLEPQGLWERVGMVSLATQTVPHLSLEDLLLYLCFHGSKHVWERLSWLCDVAELTRQHPHLDWQRLMTKAKSSGNQRVLALGLVAAHILLKSPLPAPVRQYIRDEPLIARLLRHFWHTLFHTLATSIPHTHRVPKSTVLTMLLRLQPNLWAKILVGFDMLGVPTMSDWKMLKLPPCLFPLYFFLRPLRLCREFFTRPR